MDMNAITKNASTFTFKFCLEASFPNAAWIAPVFSRRIGIGSEEVGYGSFGIVLGIALTLAASRSA